MWFVTVFLRFVTLKLMLKFFRFVTVILFVYENSVTVRFIHEANKLAFPVTEQATTFPS